MFADEQTLYAARDPHGVRPLVLGRLERGWVVASETAALDIVGASFVREVEPGELLAIDSDGMRSARFAAPEPKGCVFEYVYLARPDTTISGRSVHAARVEIGRRLAVEHPVEADLVIPVPESGTPAAIGYAQGSGIPYGQGLVKNGYVGRTFIQPVADDPPARHPAQAQPAARRDPGQAARGRRRLDRPRQHPAMRWSGCCARPARWRCTCGSRRRPCAGRASTASTSPPAPSWWPAALDAEGVRRSIGADSLGYVSLEGLVAATEQPRTRLCSACFDGHYPIALPEEARLGKHLLEELTLTPAADVADTVSGAASGDPGPIRVAPAPPTLAGRRAGSGRT